MNNVLRQTLVSVRWAFVAVATLSMFINILMLTAPLFMMQVYGRVLQSHSTETLIMLLLIALYALATLAALDVLRGMAMIRIGAWLDHQLGAFLLMGSVADSLRGAPPSAQVLRDLNMFRQFLSGSSMFPMLDSPWTPIFLFVLFVLNPLIGFMALGGAVLLFALGVFNEFAMRHPMREASQAQMAAQRAAEGLVRNADVIEAMGMLRGLTARWREWSRFALNRQSRASQRTAALSGCSKFIRLGLQITILSAGAWLVIQSTMTPGGMVAASILMGRALAPVEQAIASWRAATEARAAYGRIRALIERTPLRGGGMTLPAPRGELAVQGVGFVYPGHEEPTVRGVSFVLAPGESIGLIGPTAAGKTTLARMLVGNLPPRVGHVRLDGAEVTRWEPEDRGQYVGYLPQDVELFEGSVRDNISRFTHCSDDAVVAAARLARAHELILRLPNGYDTQIGERGTALSGGQRQRIALARALFGTPRLVVLDEPNANLDHDGEQALIDALADLKAKGVTVIVIAHRPSVLRAVDKILCLRNGAVEAIGARDEVLAKVLGSAPRGPALAAGAGAPAPREAS